ncbi:NADPH-dependent FMN reductase [Streptomyces sp. NPDC001156]
MSDIRVLAISGSLRRDSLNTRLLGEAARLATGARVEPYDGLARIPPFNEDEEHPEPPPVGDLRRRVRGADAVLIATPEYNGSLPGVLKNALDWLSRPTGERPVLTLKPVAIVGASPSPFGTLRAQLALRQVLHKMNAYVLGQPEFLLFHAHKQLGPDGRLPVDSPAYELLGDVLSGLLGLVEQQRRDAAASAGSA